MTTENIIKKIFSGRINRLHYFLSVLLIGAIDIILKIIKHHVTLDLVDNIIYGISWLMFAIGLSFMVRRLHDIRQPGYIAGIFYILYYMVVYRYLVSIVSIPLLLFLTYLFLKKSDEYTNKYGVKPPRDLKFLDALLNKK